MIALSQRRIGWLCGVFALLLGIAAIRALQLTTISAGHLASLANAEHSATLTALPARGSIVDRNGVTLAVAEAADDISATPSQIKDPVAVAGELAPLLHRPIATLVAEITHPSSPQYALLRRQLPASSADRVRALHITGIALTADPLRYYPDRYLGAQLLGGVGTAGTGLGGIELEFNSALAGTAGVQQATYDANGQPIGVNGNTAVNGQTVQLTIDAALQQYTDSVLAATGERYRAQHATAIVLDLRTNAILAMSNWPRVDANDPSKVGVSENYAIRFDYEPGSTFKVVTIGGALSEGLVTPSTAFTIPDSYRVADRTIHDAEYHPTERLTVSQILAQSSNIGAVKIGQLLTQQLGNVVLYNWIRRFGFGTPTAIDIPGADTGIVAPPAIWSGSSIGNIPIGQGIEVTPLQLLDAYGAIADGGILRTPQIVKRVGGQAIAVPHGHRILTTRVAGELRHMLLGVTRAGGTAAEIQIPGYALAGKTGTAQKAINGTYSEKYYVASFVGFAPEHDPKIEAVVVVDEPQGAIYGTEVAAPAWRTIMNFALPYMGIAAH